MKKAAVLFFGIIFFQNSFSQIIFQKTFNSATNNTTGTNVFQKSDDGYVIAMNCFSNTDYLCFIRTDKFGDTLWTKTIKASGGRDLQISPVSPCQQTANGGYIIAGRIDTESMFLMEIDSNINVRWLKQAGPTTIDAGMDTWQTSDGGFIWIRHPRTLPQNYFYTSITKTDSLGNFLWEKSFDPFNPTTIRANELLEAVDGTYMFAGLTTLGIGPSDFCLFKMDANGNYIWGKSYGEINHASSADAILQTHDGGYAIAGYMVGDSAGAADICLIRTDSSGNLLWSKVYKGSYTASAHNIEQTLDGGYIIVGSETVVHPYDYDIILVRTDSSGNLLWSKTYGGAGVDISSEVTVTSDSGYAILGYTQSFGPTKAYMIKTDKNGTSNCNENTPVILDSALVLQTSSISSSNAIAIVGGPNQIATTANDIVVDSTLCFYVSTPEILFQNSFSVFPNPATNQLTVDNGELKIERIEIYNVLGEKILSQISDLRSQTSIDVTQLPSGIYFVKVKGEKQERVAKFVKQ